MTTMTNRYELTIVGTDKKLYRGQIETCDIQPLKKKDTKQMKKQTIQNEMNDMSKIPLEQFDPTIQTVADEHLFEYLDWQNQFHQQVIHSSLKDQFPHVICRIYLMNFVKNYFNIGNPLCVMKFRVIVMIRFHH